MSRQSREIVGSAAGNETGAALIETAILAPALLFLALTVYDLTGILVEHMILSQVAREGARLASSYQFLEPETYKMNVIPPLTLRCISPTPVNYRTYSCTDGITGAACNSSAIAQQALLANLARSVRVITQSYGELSLSNLCITSQLISGSPDRVRIYIEGRYQALFPLFRDLRVAVHSDGSYT